jgi:putative exosortase-associated protein (TIGR04073 family)
MKKFLCFLLIAGFTAAAHADIQDPPAHEQGPTRKLGRAISNICFGITEVPYTIEVTNELEGNSAAASYGVIKGVGRAFYRAGAGWAELLTWTLPTFKGSYRPFYRSDIPWINGGFTEFPPELGFETKYHYSRYTEDY